MKRYCRPSTHTQGEEEDEVDGQPTLIPTSADVTLPTLAPPPSLPKQAARPSLPPSVSQTASGAPRTASLPTRSSAAPPLQPLPQLRREHESGSGSESGDDDGSDAANTSEEKKRRASVKVSIAL